MTRTVAIEPLTAEAFGPFGQVISTEGIHPILINSGTTQRYHDLARIELAGVHPRPMISLFRGQPFAFPIRLDRVERHPLGSQAFYPLSDLPFLAIVAPDESGAAGKPRAFLTRPGQGINIAMNIWHAALTPLNAASDFIVVDRGGEGENLEMSFFDEPWTIIEGS